MSVRVLRSARPFEAAGEALAARALELDRACGGGVRLGVPGGSALSALGPAREAMGRALWARVRLTWVDERCVVEADPASNRGEARRAGLLEGVGSTLPLYLDGERPEAAIARFSEAFARDFGGGLDLALLGLGPDGHVASLFPGHAALASPGPLVFVPDSPKPPAARVTLSLAVLCAAERVAVAVGRDKRDAILALEAGQGILDTLTLFSDDSTR